MASGYIPSQQDDAHRNTSKSSSSNQPINVDRNNPIKRQPEEDHEPKGRAGRPRKDGLKKDLSKTIRDPPKETPELKRLRLAFKEAMEKKYGKKFF